MQNHGSEVVKNNQPDNKTFERRFPHSHLRVTKVIVFQCSLRRAGIEFFTFSEKYLKDMISEGAFIL